MANNSLDEATEIMRGISEQHAYTLACDDRIDRALGLDPETANVVTRAEAAERMKEAVECLQWLLDIEARLVILGGNDQRPRTEWVAAVKRARSAVGREERL